MEDLMKLSVIVLSFVIGIAFASPATPASQNQEKKAADVKEARWQGTIVRISQDESTITVRGGQSNMESTEKVIRFDSSTQWTKQGKPAEQSEFKEGSFVIVLGHAEGEGAFHATRIDLRLPR
jgi:hypothetical protein